MVTPLQFIIIDDDAVNHFICSKIIQNVVQNPKIETFMGAQAGIEYIENNYPREDQAKTILFLDLNMPVLSGWDFIELFKKMKEEIRNNITIYILSSSSNPDDYKLAESHDCIQGFLVKPLTRERIMESTQNA